MKVIYQCEVKINKSYFNTLISDLITSDIANFKKFFAENKKQLIRVDILKLSTKLEHWTWHFHKGWKQCY